MKRSSLALISSLLMALAACGSSTTPQRSTPAQTGGAQPGKSRVVIPKNPLTGVAAVYTGSSHSCALMNNGSVSCWGYPDVRVATPIPGISSAQMLALGSGSTCAMLKSGEVVCWGDNESGQLGDGTRANREKPEPVQNIKGASAVFLASHQGCAMVEKSLLCWGETGHGPFHRLTDVKNVLSISMGHRHHCVTHTDGKVTCWGNTQASRDNKYTIPELTDVAQVAVGLNHSCVLLKNGRVQCWGNNHYGQCGTSDKKHQSTPVTVLGVSAARHLSLGHDHSCVLLENGSVQCWGGNERGQLGNGTTDHNYNPGTVQDLSDVKQLSSNGSHNCALLSSGQVKCWGANYSGQLGNGTVLSSTLPVTVMY